MAGRWNPALHPRDADGKFKPKLSQSVRLSTRSVSYNAGVRLPIIPGRANLYVGALARVERAGSGNRFFKRTTNRAVDALARRFGDPEGKSGLAQILKGNPISVKGNRIKGPNDYVNNPTFRISRTPATRAQDTVSLRRRRPRVQRVNRARTPNISSTIKTSAPTAAIGAVNPRAPRRKPRKRSRR